VGKTADDVPPYRGALRPTVAAAMVRLAVSASSPAARATGLYDPFCGSGTIVAEAVQAGLATYASDVSEEALTITMARLAALGVPTDELAHRVFERDVRRGPDQRVTAQLVAANLPWGAQVPIERRLELFDAVGILVASRIAAGGAAVLLTTHEDALAARLRRHGLRVTARRVGLLGQTPGLLVARPPA
jgi:23S rRNA G2445 N2-methylase RlmL